MSSSRKTNFSTDRHGDARRFPEAISFTNGNEHYGPLAAGASAAIGLIENAGEPIPD